MSLHFSTPYTPTVQVLATLVLETFFSFYLSVFLDLFSISISLPSEFGYCLDGVMHSFVWTIGLLLVGYVLLRQVVAVPIFTALCVLVPLHWAVMHHWTILADICDKLLQFVTGPIVGVFGALWILCWAVQLFYHKTVGWLHSFFILLLAVLERCMQSRALRAEVDPVADEVPDAEEPAAEEPAADDCVNCKSCSNDKPMHFTVKKCPCCNEEILSSANSESACVERCDNFSKDVHDCDDGQQCTLHSNHLGECLFKFSDKAVEATDSAFEPEEDSSEAKIAGTDLQNATILSFDAKVRKILEKRVTNVEEMCEFFGSCHCLLRVVTPRMIFQRGPT